MDKVASRFTSCPREQEEAGRYHQDCTAQHGFLMYQAGVGFMVVKLIDGHRG